VNFEELVQKVENLPNVGQDFGSYLIDISRTGRPSSAFVTLIPHRDGSWTATQGDFREKVETVIGTDGAPVRFPDEDAACRWAWQKIKSARSNLGEKAEDRAAALKDAQVMYERIRRLDEAQGVESPFA
jgi:hypothetical protein